MKNITRNVKPCPFCNGTAYLEPYSKTIVKGSPRRSTFVACGVCGARGPRVLYPEGYTGKKDAFLTQARESWNRRDREKELVFDVSRKFTKFVAETFDSEQDKEFASAISSSLVKLLRDTSESIPEADTSPES